MGTADYVVPDELAGERADRVVSALAGLSRSAARRLVEEGGATFDGEMLRPSSRVGAGAELSVVLPGPPPSMAPEPVPFDVLYEDDDVAVVAKPAGMVVHPGAGNEEGTLAAGLLHRWPELAGVGEKDRWGIVHRLDRDTSGALIVAKTSQAHLALRRQLEDREVRRVYLALATGEMTAQTGTIDAPIGRDPSRPTRFRVERHGRPARTHYRRLAGWTTPPLTLLEVELETGRTHQIRVHLSSIGHALVGDAIYGRAAGLDRVWLHAARLEFEHPVTGESMEVEAPLAEELVRSLRELGPPDVGAPPVQLTTND